MKLENMNQEFPKMPDSMRKMMEQEVEQQLQKKTRKFTGRRVMIAVLAATLALGTTAFAGVLYRMKSQQVGTYAVKTTQENVLCRFRCITSKPISPGRATPITAFKLAPS